MPHPTDEQLSKINKLSHTKLEKDQVYVFRSLSADTLPVKRFGWFGEYTITMSSKMLNDLKKDYRKGVGLLASHNYRRLPFGRTFDAEVIVDYVDDEPVETLYVDHYIVTHVKDEEGNKIPLLTEVNGMTTQDIVNHIEVGHTFDTSIGFSITEPICSICKNDIRDYDKCKHIPGNHYEVQVGDKTERVRCDIIANGGEGLENSLVYAGAVDRATITRNEFSIENQSINDAKLQNNVNNYETTLYNVDDIKAVPLQAEILCKLSRGNIQLFTVTPERYTVDYSKGSEEMPTENKTVTNSSETTISLEEYNKVVADKEAFSARVKELEKEVEKFEQTISELTTQLQEANGKIEEMSAKVELADKFTEDLIQEVVKAGVKARGNAFNKERYERYARTLTVDELKQELEAFRGEFSGNIEEARLTVQEIQEERSDEVVNLSKAEMRQLAAKKALERYKREGGDLEALTREELSKLESSK